MSRDGPTQICPVPGKHATLLVQLCTGLEFLRYRVNAAWENGRLTLRSRGLTDSCIDAGHREIKNFTIFFLTLRISLKPKPKSKLASIIFVLKSCSLYWNNVLTSQFPAMRSFLMFYLAMWVYRLYMQTTSTNPLTYSRQIDQGTTTLLEYRSDKRLST